MKYRMRCVTVKLKRVGKMLRKQVIYEKNLNEKTLKKIYERSKSGMLKKFGRVLSYDEFVSVLAYAHDHKMVQGVYYGR